MSVSIWSNDIVTMPIRQDTRWTLKQYKPKAHPDAIIQTNQARFTILTKNLIRMEYDPSGIFDDRPSRIFLNRYTQPPYFTMTNDGVLIVSTDDLKVTYSGGEFDSSSLTISGNVNDFDFQFKPSGDVNIDNGWSENLFGTFQSLDDLVGNVPLNCSLNSDVAINFDWYGTPISNILHCVWTFFGMKGYAIIDDTNTTMMDHNWFSEARNRNKQDIYFFGHGRNFKQAIFDYTLIAGSIPMIPRYALGSMHTRWFHYDDHAFKAMIQQYETKSIPLDIAIFDMDWHYLNVINKPWGDYSWSNLLFPNPNITQLWLHNIKNLRTAANLHDETGIQTFENNYKQAANSLNVTNNKDIPVNISDYYYMMTLQDHILEPISNRPSCNGCGFDVWWSDWQQGQYGLYLKGNISPQFILAYVRGTNNIRLKRNVRNVVLGRFGGMGSHRYPVGFSGDFDHQWDSLQYLPYFTATAANVLFSWSNDIYGGLKHQGYDLNVRWVQFGAYSPIFRIHDRGQGVGECALKSDCALPDIWTHPYQYFDIERKVIQERAELLPYIYNATYTAYKYGILLVRSMYIDYPLEYNSYPTVNNVIRNQYMFGDAIIVSPITKPGDLMDMVTTKIWLPSTKQFYEKHSGKIIDKQMSVFISRSFSLSEIPIYIETGSIIPILPFNNKHVLGRANELSYDRLRFDIYPFLNDNNQHKSTFLYEDDGITFDYLDETNFVQTNINWTYNAKANKFIATIVSNAYYNGFILNRYYGIRIYNVLSPKYVKCDNKSIHYNPFYFDNFAKANTYYFDAETMSLTINCPQSVANITTTIKVIFARKWSNDFKYTSVYGMKGKINRAMQCKAVLDEVNYPYGVSYRSNMTFIATYSTILGNIGNDYNLQYKFVKQFHTHWENAVKEVKLLNLTLSGLKRYTFCNQLLQI